MELKELTGKFQNIFGNLENFKIDLLNNSNSEKFIELVNGDLETDYLQKIWQFYMADREDKKQDFTPKSLGKLVAELTKSTTEEWCYDMCSGSGALTIQKWITNKNLKFVCEELDTNLIPFLLFNLKIRNIEGYVINGNVLTGERKAVYKLTKGEKFSEIEFCMFFEYPNFDCGISNPPFNLKGEYKEEIELKNMNFVFILKMLERVKEKVAFILPNGVMGSSEEKEARKQKGEEHTQNRVYTKILKTYSDEQIKTILTCIKEKKDIENFSRCIKNSEIQDEIWLPNTYIDIKIEPSKSRSYEDIIKDLQRVMSQKNQNKLTINEVWAKELGFLEIFETANNGDKTVVEINNTIKNVLKLDFELPKQDYIRITKSKELKWENKDKEELSSAITIALQTWKTMLHYFNNEENRYLKELRDKLLPDLMSGKLEVNIENE